MDVAIIDVPWNGIATSRRVADMAEAYEIAIAPHNHYSHLATYHAAHLCASVPNVRICEMEIDDVPWKDEMVTVVPEIRDGFLTVPTEPGWGTEMRGGRAAGASVASVRGSDAVKERYARDQLVSRYSGPQSGGHSL